MFDTVDAGIERGADAVCAVGVDGDFDAEQVGFVDDGVHFLLGELLRADLGAFGEDAACAAELDDGGAVFDVLADFGAHAPWAVCDAAGGDVIFGGQEVVVAMAAGDADAGAGDEHAWADDLAAVDGVTQGDIGKGRAA